MDARSRLNDRGYSLAELMVVLAIMGTAASMVALVSPAYLRQARSDAGLAQALEIIKNGRELGISSRRNIQLRFLGNNVIQIARVEIPGPAVTVVRTVEFEGTIRFLRVPGVPDTPDLFGNAGAVAFGPSPTRLFTSEGTLVDSNGDVLNGTLFLATPNVIHSARAVTIFGATGLMRTWRWDGARWLDAAR